MSRFTLSEISDVAAIGPLESPAAQDALPDILARLMAAANVAGETCYSTGFALIVGANDLSGGPARQMLPLTMLPAGTVISECLLYGVGFSVPPVPTFNASGYQFIAFDTSTGAQTALTGVLTPSAVLTEVTLTPAVELAADSAVVLMVYGLAAAVEDIVRADVLVELPVA